MHFQLYDSQLIYKNTKDPSSKGNIQTTVFTGMSYNKRSKIIIQVIFQYWGQERDCIFTMIKTMLTYYIPTKMKNGDIPQDWQESGAIRTTDSQYMDECQKLC